MGSGGEARCNCLPLHAVMCSRVTCAHTPAHVGSRWHCTQNSWVPVKQTTSERNLSPRRVCAHCAYCEQCTCNRFLVCTLAFFGNLLLSRSLSLFVTLSLSLSSFLSCALWWVSTLSADARAHCANYEQCSSRDLVYTIACGGCLV